MLRESRYYSLLIFIVNNVSLDMCVYLLEIMWSYLMSISSAALMITENTQSDVGPSPGYSGYGGSL